MLYISIVKALKSWLLLKKNFHMPTPAQCTKDVAMEKVYLDFFFKLTAILENSTPMVKKNILGSLSRMSVRENFAHIIYTTMNMRKGNHGEMASKNPK